MYRILIVDDEPYIVDWISDLINSESGLETDIYRSYSALDALKWLEKTKMDILITDICMPIMDGLSLLEKANRLWPNCKVIFITGHAEFDYAYTAIRNNIVSYILKTDDDEQILTAVKKAAALIDKELINIQVMNIAKEQMKEASQVIVKDCFFKMLRGDYEHLHDLKEQYAALGLKIDFSQPSILLVCKLEGMSKTLTLYKKYELIIQVENIVEYFISANVVSIPVEYGHMRLMWFIQPDPNSDWREEGDILWGKTVTFVMGMLENVQSWCKETLDLNIAFILTNTPVQDFEFSDRFEYMEQFLYYNVDEKAGVILTDSGFHKRKNQTIGPQDTVLEKVRLDLNKLEMLETYLEQGQKEEFKACLSGICERLRTITSRNHSSAKEIYFTLAVMFLSHINRRRIVENLSSRISLGKLTKLEEHTSWNEAVDYLYQLTDVFFDLHKKNQDQVTIDLVDFIRKYVDDHIGEDVSLVKLSEVTGYNPSYLSRLYKRKAGGNIYDYITKVRIDKAKQLLEHTDMGLNEISTQVGFEHRTVFNRFFKRLSNMTPQEYRDYVRLGK